MSDEPIRGEESGEPAVVRQARLYTVLAGFWILPSLGALVILVHAGWPEGGGTVEGWLRAVRLEQWVATIVLMAHIWMVGRARRCRRAAR